MSNPPPTPLQIPPLISLAAMRRRTKTYGERAGLCANPAGAQLLRIMEEKKTNLSVAVDVTQSAELVRLADLLGPSICMLKVHIPDSNGDGCQNVLL